MPRMRWMRIAARLGRGLRSASQTRPPIDRADHDPPEHRIVGADRERQLLHHRVHRREEGDAHGRDREGGDRGLASDRMLRRQDRSSPACDGAGLEPPTRLKTDRCEANLSLKGPPMKILACLALLLTVAAAARARARAHHRQRSGGARPAPAQQRHHPAMDQLRDRRRAAMSRSASAAASSTCAARRRARGGRPARRSTATCFGSTPRSFTFRGRDRRSPARRTPTRNCLRDGTYEFRVTGRRRYWRLQQMEACDGLTDYVDIYF